MTTLRYYHYYRRGRDYLELTKPRVLVLITFTTVGGMLLATTNYIPWNIILFGSLGITLTAGSAAAINHLVDCKVDAIMARTNNRPLPSGQLNYKQVVIFATIIGICGLSLLVVFTNKLTVILTLSSLLGYAVLYTIFLKRATPQNIVIGGAAGAAPPLLGWTAVTSQLDVGALLLFLIIYVWTPAHFWALAIHRYNEYSDAKIPMLPVTHGIEFTRLYILLYVVLLFITTLMPFLTGMSSYIYLFGATILGVCFLFHAIRLYIIKDDKLAISTFSFSIFYLFGLFTVLMIDHYTPQYYLSLLFPTF